MQYKPDPPTPYASVPRGQAPGLFSPAAGTHNAFASNLSLSNTASSTPYATLGPAQETDIFAKHSGALISSASSAHRSVASHQGNIDATLPPKSSRPTTYTRVETAFMIEEAKAKLLRLYQQEESLGLHLEAKRHSLLHLKSEIARTDQLIREFERKRVFDLQQDANDRSLSPKDMEEVEKLSQDILKEERIVSQLQALLEETQIRKTAFQEQLNRDSADRAEIKAAMAKLSGKAPSAP